MYKLIRPLLFARDAEDAHDSMGRIGQRLSHSWVKKPLAVMYGYANPLLESDHFGLHFPNPVGLAAGFDKHARMVDFLPALGFGFLEVGTVTPIAQPGNDRPRLFRLPHDNAIINRMGFNNGGVEPLKQELAARRERIILGGNIGLNKTTPHDQAVDDYLTCFRALYPYVDYFVVNVSSPNTPNLRQLQDKEPLKQILSALQQENKQQSTPRPLLLKIAPDLTDGQLNDIIDVVTQTQLSGVIATNTTISREGLRTPAERIEEIGMGGLSGQPVAQLSTRVIEYLYTRLPREIPIIGVGGIASAQDAYDKICAGASLVQVYTGLIYEGPGLVKKINRGLVELVQRDGFASITQAIGSKHNS